MRCLLDLSIRTATNQATLVTLGGSILLVSLFHVHMKRAQRTLTLPIFRFDDAPKTTLLQQLRAQYTLERLVDSVHAQIMMGDEFPDTLRNILYDAILARPNQRAVTLMLAHVGILNLRTAG